MARRPTAARPWRRSVRAIGLTRCGSGPPQMTLISKHSTNDERPTTNDRWLASDKQTRRPGDTQIATTNDQRPTTNDRWLASDKQTRRPGDKETRRQRQH